MDWIHDIGFFLSFCSPGQADEARALIAAVPEDTPGTIDANPPGALQEGAYYEFRQGDLNRALRAYRKGLGRDADPRTKGRILNAVARVQAKAGAFEAAVRTYREILLSSDEVRLAEDMPLGPAAHLELGRLLDIYSVAVEGGSPKRLTATGNNGYPCWSPDGTSVAFIGFEGGEDRRANIFTMPAEGGPATKITSPEDGVYRYGASIAWSPDGKYLAYFSEDATINIIPSAGGAARGIVQVDPVTNHSDMAWSPDGREIAYVSAGNIWAVQADGGDPRRIPTGVDAKINHLSWSPDGRRIAFSASRGGDAGLWLVSDFLPLVRR